MWRHNEHDGVSSHWSLDCLLKRLFRRRSKKASELRVTCLCERNSPVTGELPTQRASNGGNTFDYFVMIISVCFVCMIIYPLPYELVRFDHHVFTGFCSTKAGIFMYTYICPWQGYRGNHIIDSLWGRRSSLDSLRDERLNWMLTHLLIWRISFAVLESCYRRIGITGVIFFMPKCY